MDHDLVEVRYTHMRDSTHHYTTHYASLLHGTYYFLVYLWQGVAVGLECSKLINYMVM